MDGGVADTTRTTQAVNRQNVGGCCCSTQRARAHVHSSHAEVLNPTLFQDLSSHTFSLPTVFLPPRYT